MDQTQKQRGELPGDAAAETDTPAPQHLTDPHTTERPEDSVEATAADTANGLGPNSQAPTLRHEIQGER